MRVTTRSANHADGRYGHLSLLSARSALRFITPISPHPTRACLAVGRSNARDVWRRRGWTASSAPALSARSRRATRIVRPQQQRMKRSRRDRAGHWDACSRSTTPPSPASASAPPRSASAGVANGSRTSAICPPGQTGKRFLPKRSLGSIHSACLSALVRRPRDGNVVSFLHCMNDPRLEGHMASYIARRKFLATLGGAAAAWPLAARAQQAAKLPTIGYLGANSSSAESQRVAAFMQRLRELGWIESRNVTIEYLYAEGRSERYAEFAAEFVRLKVDVIVTSGTAAVIAAKQATSLIPIVFAVAGDPVGT